LVAPLALPLFDNASMDGFAVVAGSCRVGARLKIVGEQAAGVDRRLSITAGEAVRIFTGAPIPRGTDAVIMQEETRVEGDELVPTSDVEPGENIRRRGADVAEGQKILTAGERLGPQTLALLAAQGIASVEVGGQPRVALISTGDELVDPGTPLRSGEIYDSNAVLLRALLQKGGATVTSVLRCGDRAEELENALRAGTAADLMIITGGVSVGARDFVKPALTAVGATLDLWRVSLKPGKPFLFGRAGRCAIFGLPGNPVSAFVTFLLFVRPALSQLSGARDEALTLRRTTAKLAAELRNPGDRPHYIRGLLLDGTFTPVGRQESHALFGLSRSNALVRVPPGFELKAMSEVSVLTWD
jgi:molybdopterin molybdotransferase